MSHHAEMELLLALSLVMTRIQQTMTDVIQDVTLSMESRAARVLLQHVFQLAETDKNHLVRFVMTEATTILDVRQDV